MLYRPSVSTHMFRTQIGKVRTLLESEERCIKNVFFRAYIVSGKGDSFGQIKQRNAGNKSVNPAISTVGGKKGSAEDQLSLKGWNSSSVSCG